jgi:hypothetical protein
MLFHDFIVFDQARQNGRTHTRLQPIRLPYLPRLGKPWPSFFFGFPEMFTILSPEFFESLTVMVRFVGIMPLSGNSRGSLHVSDFEDCLAYSSFFIDYTFFYSFTVAS